VFTSVTPTELLNPEDMDEAFGISLLSGVRPAWCYLLLLSVFLCRMPYLRQKSVRGLWQEIDMDLAIKQVGPIEILCYVYELLNCQLFAVVGQVTCHGRVCL